MERRSLVAGIAVCPPPRLCLAAGLRQPPSEGGARARLPTLLLFGVRSQSAYRGFVFVRRFVLLRQFVWRALPLPEGGGHKALGLNIFSWIGTATAFEATVYWFESNRMLNYFIYFIKAGVPKKKAGSFSLQRWSPCPPQHILKI